MFNYTDIRIFDKKGSEIPLMFTGSLPITIPNKYGDNAVFYAVTDPDKNIDGYYAKSRGGRFTISDYEDFGVDEKGNPIKNDGYRSKTSDYKYDYSMDFFSENDVLIGARIPDGDTLKSVQIPATVRVMESSENTKDFKEYYIEGIGGTRIVDGERKDMICFNLDDIMYPSVTLNGNISFDTVSTDLVETQSLFFLVETTDVCGNKTFVKLGDYAATDPQCAEWISRYKLLLFIDCRSQKDFRFFTESEDEVVWTDRVVVDFCNNTDDGYDVAGSGGYRVNIGFTGSNEGVYEDRAYICVVDTQAEKEFEGDPGAIYPIGSIGMSAETIGEDERYRTLFTNFGIPDPIEYPEIYKDTDEDESNTDMILLNQHSKKMFLSYSEIFPYMGSYKALVNALSTLGYNDIFFKEWFKEMSSNTSEKNSYVAYNVAYKTNDFANSISNLTLEERVHLKKLNWLSMMYKLNDENSTVIDKFGFPEVNETYNYYNSGNIVKLISLKKWLEKYILGLNCRIIDIGGEGVYFERYSIASYGSYQQNIQYDSVKNISPHVDTDKAYVLYDSSTMINVHVDNYDSDKSFEDLEEYRFIDFCYGYFDEDGTYYNNKEIVDSSTNLYMGAMFGNFATLHTYEITAQTDTDGIILGKDFVSDNSPALEIKDGNIQFISSDLVTKDKNTAFTNTPILLIEDAVLKTISRSFAATRYTIRRDESSGVSKCILSSTSGTDYIEEIDYIRLVPPTYREDDENTYLTPINGKEITVKKSYTPDITYDFEKSEYQKTVYSKNTTTYGLRYTVTDTGSPIFAIKGYQTSNADNFRISNEEMCLELQNGLMIFDDAEHGRRIILKFTYDDETNETTVATSCVYSGDCGEIITYNDGTDTINHFFNGTKYKEFVSKYINDADNAIAINSNISLKVYNAGTYNVNVTAKDYQNNVYSANAKNVAVVTMPAPTLTLYDNEETSLNEFNESGTEVAKDALDSKYVNYCILDYKPSSIGIEPMSTVSEEDSINTKYSIDEYFPNVPSVGDYAHFTNSADAFDIIAIDAAEEDVINSNVLSYYLVLKRRLNAAYGRLCERYDTKAIIYASTGSRTEESGCSTISEALKKSYQKGTTLLDVNVVLYNTLGDFPVIQVPGVLACGACISDDYNDTEYHLYLRDDVEKYYVWRKEETLVTKEKADVDSNGEVNSADVAAIDNYLINGEKSGITKEKADVDSDGQVSAADKTAVYNYIQYGGDDTEYRDNLLRMTIDGVNYYAVAYKDSTGEKQYVKTNASLYDESGNYDDIIKYLISERNTVVYVQPNWMIEATVLNTDPVENTTRLRYQSNTYRNIFKVGEMIKISLKSLSNDTYISQAAYKVKSIDAESNTFTVYGQLNKSYIANIDDKTVQCAINLDDKSESGEAYRDVLRVVDGILESRILTKKADVNSDGVVNQADVVAINNYILFGEASGITKEKADVDANGVVTASDAVAVNNYIIHGVVTKEKADVDSNGDVNSADVAAIDNYMMNGEVSGITKEKADVDSDGQVSAADKTAVYNYINYGSLDDYVETWSSERIYKGVKYTVSAKYDTDNAKTATKIYYTVYYYDAATNKIYPLYEKDSQDKISLQAYVSYAHDAFVDYPMKVLDSSTLENTVTISLETTTHNKRISRYIDDMFRVTYRPFDTNNAINYWMDSNYADDISYPAIKTNKIYEYDCPITVRKNNSNAAFCINFSKLGLDYDTSYVTWNVYKRSDSHNKKKLLFTSNNKDLFMETNEPGLYDISAFVRDKYGNGITKMFSGAYTVLDELCFNKFDVNRDGKVDTADITAIYNYIENGEKSGISKSAADVNGDGKVNSADIMAVCNYLISGGGDN